VWSIGRAFNNQDIHIGMSTIKKYNTIYADPPWSYDNKKTGRALVGSGANMAADDKYDTLSLDQLCALPIKKIVEKDCILFMWAVVPMMPEALQVIEAWGFKYKTMLTWRKIKSQGLGYWFRGQCEHLLVATKGSPKAFRQQVCNYYESEYDLMDDHVHQQKVGRHSQKPGYFRDLISKAVTISFEEPKKLELFARTREGMFGDMEYEGWDVYGNEVNNSIILP
jgi:site-specific DNA-methyltransferase (adenine-specific)